MPTTCMDIIVTLTYVKDMQCYQIFINDGVDSYMVSRCKACKAKNIEGLEESSTGKIDFEDLKTGSYKCERMKIEKSSYLLSCRVRNSYFTFFAFQKYFRKESFYNSKKSKKKPFVNMTKL